jgi:biopolymer transport protein ExbD
MRRKKGGESSDVKMDMTPMIDCVFLLILFFLLTTEMTVQVEEVDLPYALEAREDKEKGADDAPILINVVRDRKNAANNRAGKIIYNSETQTLEKLTRALQLEADHHAKPPPHGKGNGWEDGQFSKLRVIIRADRGVESQYLRTVFTACAKAKIYKLKVSGVQPEGS